MNPNIPELCFKILAIISRAFKKNKHRSNTDRALALIKSTHECNLDKTNEFLDDFYYRKLSAEIYGVELEKYRLTIAKKIIEDSGYQIRWDMIKTALPYLSFSENKMNVNYNKLTSFSNWTSFIIAILILTYPFGILFYINHNGISVTLSNSILLGSIFILFLIFGLAMLLSTSDFFAARSIKSLLK